MSVRRHAELSGSSRLLCEIIEHNGRQYVFDGRTYSITEIDDLHALLLKSWHIGFGSLSRKLCGKYKSENIQKAYGDIRDFLEKGVFSYNDDPYVEAPPFNKVVLLLAEDCNLACRYCFEEGKTRGGSLGRMSIEVATVSLQRLFEKSGTKEVQIQFYGGEPLLNFEVLKYSVSLGQELSVQHNKTAHYILITNGTLINDDIALFLAENKISVQISVDATPSAHNKNRIFHDGRGSYNRVLKGISFLKKHNVPYNAMVVVNRAVLSEDNWMNEARELTADGLGMCSVATGKKELQPSQGQWTKFIHNYQRNIEEETSYYTHPGKLFPSILRLKDQIKSGKRFYFGCGCGLSELTIGASGDVYLCERMEINTGRKIGDFGSMSDFWRPYVTNVLNKCCSNCWAKYLCGGGCAHTRLAINGKNAPFKWDCKKRKLEIQSAVKCLVNEYNCHAKHIQGDASVGGI